MIYKFRIVSDEVDNFKREICIDSDATFLELHDAILDSVGFTKDQMTSFFICDDDWEKKTEVTLMDMGKDSDEDTWIMASTRLSELIEDEGQRLVFVFDYHADRGAQGFAFVHSREYLAFIGLLARGCYGALPRGAPVQVRLNVVFRQRQIGRATVHDATHSRTVALSESRHPKQSSKNVSHWRNGRFSRALYQEKNALFPRKIK